MIAVLNAAATIWYCMMPFMVLVNSPLADASLEMYKWITFLFSLILVLPTLVICRWLTSKDTRVSRKRMARAYLAILLWNMIRIIWIIGGSWLILDTSVYYYIVRLEAGSKREQLEPDLEAKKNDQFVTIQILELFFLTLFYWYFWQVAQRFKNQYNRSSRYLPDDEDAHNQMPTERQLNQEQ